MSAKVLLPSGDDMLYSTVLRRKPDANGNVIGRSHTNPILNTSVYEVLFQDGHVEAYNANLILKTSTLELMMKGIPFTCLTKSLIIKRVLML
jgi:hypothetical protein